MSLSSARFAFVFLLVLNVIIWSQSRYGYIEGPGSIQNLVKRAVSEPGIGDPWIFGHKEKQCQPPAFPADSQCKHVHKACPASQTFLSINYLSRYFCTGPSLRPIAFTGLLIWLIFLFSTLGISASEFFTPNLATISHLLGLDENVAGVTFLAFGNGSPDVFSTFSAMKADSGSLAIGELLGAASFIVSCVVGSMCIVKPFEVNRGPFLRDVGFFSVAVGLLLFILWDHRIHRWEALVLVGLYLFYVATVVIGSWWERKQESQRRAIAQTRSEYQGELSQTFLDPYRDDPSRSPSPSQSLVVPPTPSRTRAISHPVPPRIQTSLPPRPRSRTPSPSPRHHLRQLPSFSLAGALEFRHVVASLRASGSDFNMFESPVTPFAGGHYHASLLGSSASVSRSNSISRTGRGLDLLDTELGVPLDERPLVSVTPADDSPNDRHYDDYFNIQSAHRSSSVPSIMHTPASPTLSDGEQESKPFGSRDRRQTIIIFHRLFPSLHNFRDKTTMGKITTLFAAPAVLCLTLTLPVVVTPYQHTHLSQGEPIIPETPLIEIDEDGVERTLMTEPREELDGLPFSKWLMAIQCILGPLFCVGVLFSTNKYLLWFLLAAAVAGFAMAVLVAIFATNGNNPTMQMVRCSMGFLVATVWIMAIADEVVNVLQTFGFIFGLSDAIIGLTIFAVGNSLADLVANTSVAVFAPIMGFSACFGGPMLNILLGVGISGSYIMQQTGTPYDLYFSTTLLVSTVGLLMLLAATLIFVPLNDYFLTRTWGIFLIVSYITIMAINVIVELRS